jgi:hypothetical protein
MRRRSADDGDDEAEAKEKALAEHVARHPEDVGRTVEAMARNDDHGRKSQEALPDTA